LDNSEIPSHMGIYSEKFNPDKGVVKIHIHWRFTSYTIFLSSYLL
jgi:hypothetical protein